MFASWNRITDISSNAGFVLPVERTMGDGRTKRYSMFLEHFLDNVIGQEVSGTNVDVRNGYTFRIDTALDTHETTLTAFSLLASIPASSTVTAGIATTVWDFVGTVEGTTLRIDNAGAGANPTLTSNAADQTATFTGNLTITGNLLVSGDTVTNNVATYAVEDNNILLGDGQAANSETGAGIDIEANAIVTAWLRVAEVTGVIGTDDGWGIKAPDNANQLLLGLNLLTAERTLTAPDLSGTIAVLAAAATFTNISLTDDANQIVLDSNAPAGASTTLTDSATAARVITFPDATDTIVVLGLAQTLTSKTLTAPDINGGTWNGSIDGAWTAAGQTCADLGTVTTALITTCNFNNVGAGADPSFASNDAGQVLDLTGSLDISGALTLGTDLAVAQGGTGVSTLADGGLVIGNAAGAVEVVAAGLTTQILVGGGALTAPVWGTDIPTAVTIGGSYVYRAGGTDVEMLTGGTGASLAAVNGGIVYSGAAAMAISAAGTALQALVSGGAGAPTWSAITIDGTVANVMTLRNGTSLLDVAAGISLDVNANLTVNSATTMGAFANTICNTADVAAFKIATALTSGIDIHAYTANGNTILTDAGLLSIAGVATVADRFLTTTGVDTFAAQTITASGIALVGQTIAVDQMVYGTGAGTWAAIPLTAAARSILDDATVGAIATTLGLGTGDSPTFVGVNLTGQLNVDVANTPALLTSTQNAVSVQVGYFEGTKGAGAALDNDEIYVSFAMKNDAAAQMEIARLYAVFADVNVGTGEDSELQFSVRTAGALAKELALSGTALYPSTDDGLILGSATNRFSDLFLALGAVINFDNGDVTITHGAGALTFGGDGAVTIDFNNHEMVNVDIDSGVIDITSVLAVTGVQSTPVARTATADGTGTGTIADLTSYVTATNGGDINNIIVLPAPTPGRIVKIFASAAAMELRTSNPATIAINGGTGAAAESALVANSLNILICTSATTWVGYQVSTVGAVSAVEVAA